MAVGHDFEFFILDKNNKIVVDPKKLKNHPRLGYDGLALEINTNQNITCREDQWEAISETLKCIEENYLKPGERLVFDPVVPIDESQYTEEQLALGCNPTKNIYGLKGEEPKGLRTIGAHYHFGFGSSLFFHTKEKPFSYAFSVDGFDKIMEKYSKGEIVWDKEKKQFLMSKDSVMHYANSNQGIQTIGMDYENFIRLLDRTMGVIDAYLHDDSERRKYYGLPGEFRFQPHGIEYRTLSTQTIVNKYRWFLFQGIAKEIDSHYPILNSWTEKALQEFKDEEVIETILSCDRRKAKKHIVKLCEIIYESNSKLNELKIEHTKLASKGRMDNLGWYIWKSLDLDTFKLPFHKDTSSKFNGFYGTRKFSESGWYFTATDKLGHTTDYKQAKERRRKYAEVQRAVEQSSSKKIKEHESAGKPGKGNRSVAATVQKNSETSSGIFQKDELMF